MVRIPRNKMNNIMRATNTNTEEEEKEEKKRSWNLRRCNVGKLTKSLFKTFLATLK